MGRHKTWTLVWHSKADKIVDNFHDQKPFQFQGQTLIFMVKTGIFYVPILQKFLGRSPFHLDDKILCPETCSIPMAKFYAQPHSIPTETRGQPRLLAVFLRQFRPSLGTATKAILFTDGLGLPGKLAERVSQTVHLGIISIVFIIRGKGNCGKRMKVKGVI